MVQECVVFLAWQGAGMSGTTKPIEFVIVIGICGYGRQRRHKTIEGRKIQHPSWERDADKIFGIAENKNLHR